MNKLPKIIVCEMETATSKRWVAYVDDKKENPVYAIGYTPEDALGKLIINNLYLVKNYVEIIK